MSIAARILRPTVFVVLGLALAGCGNSGGMSQKELDSMKTSPKMTDANRATVAAAMAGGAEARRKAEADWAKAHAAETAKINAERAKMGRPPLGN
ncbi:hypothetical protein [Fimbriimonas ginsengisoli]|uniref:Lipoprotein n=1 Tax=Fimbriimonas ginsengisoli Gsoil 348 TaxID=661478 RepID=A0A068NKQ4_FIMGI|nr:hypothetical protein [Fimbriimonas ginsengisoli]AIE84158.1 hypothetical protein OP10G_0790 [Fimbriimonas ginsengisoli Gsoil 348]